MKSDEEPKPRNEGLPDNKFLFQIMLKNIFYPMLNITHSSQGNRSLRRTEEITQNKEDQTNKFSKSVNIPKSNKNSSQKVTDQKQEEEGEVKEKQPTRRKRKRIR